jgi:two-component system alkaline phosphatase synthesis response regulator PhoP
MMKPVILCIDEEPLVLHTRTLVLQSAGFGVLPASTVPEALQLFHCGVVDAVLLGHNLPETDGYELVARMKSVKPDVPILMLVFEYSMPQDDFPAAEVFKMKDDGPRALIKTLRELLASSQSATPSSARSLIGSRWAVKCRKKGGS